MIKKAASVTIDGSGHHLASQNQDVLVKKLLPFLKDPLSLIKISMRIAIWSDTFPPQVNGVASVAHDLASALTEIGHDVAVFTVTGKQRTEKTPGGKTFAVEKIPSLSMPKSMYAGDEYALALMPSPKTIYALKKFKPDIIHAHTPFLAGWGAVLGKKMLHVPLVGTHHTFYDDYLRHVKLDYQWGRKFSWKYMIAYYNRSNAVTTPTRALGDALVEHGLTVPLRIIPNPANTEFFVPAKSVAEKNRLKKKYGIGRHGIVYMGRTSYEKDIDQALAAFNIARREIPDATFMIVGDGPERKKLEHLATDPRLCRQNHIHRHAARRRVAEACSRRTTSFSRQAEAKICRFPLSRRCPAAYPSPPCGQKGFPRSCITARTACLRRPTGRTSSPASSSACFPRRPICDKASVAAHKLADRYSKKT